MADRIGQRLGNYRLVQLLGQGGFAEVYLGEHVYLETQAAIKVLQTQLAREDIEQFRIEARTIARLEHPHIVRVLEFGVEGSLPFLVMSYATGGTLRQHHLKGTRLELPTVVSYVKQMASALQYAHDQKIIHRDVKPENMLLGRHDEVLLSDFGIALVAQTSRLQLTQSSTGTVAYMAPEQIRGKPSRASDQYSLGIVVYEWLSGTLPFQGLAFEVLGQHLEESPAPLRERVPALSPVVEQVVMTALTKDPKQRWASVQAFAHALEQASQVSAGEAVLSSQSPPSPDALTSLRETQQPTKLATSVSQSSLPTEQSTPSSHTALRADALTVPSDSQQATELGAPSSQASLPKDVISEAAPTEAATRSPERSGGEERVPEVMEERSPEEEGLREAREAWAYKAEMERARKAEKEQARRDVEEELRKAREEQARRAEKERLRKAEEEKAQKASEERARKAEKERAQQRVSISPPLGTVLCTYRGHADFVSSVAWSPDGRRIASAGSSYEIHLWDAANGKHRFTYRDRSLHIAVVAWSPDGRRIASAHGESGGDHWVQVWHVAGKEKSLIYRGHARWVRSVAWSPDGRRIASAADDGIQVWDATDGGIIYTSGSAWWTNYARLVAWSPDGRRIASSRSEKVQVWDASDGRNSYTYQGHSGTVSAVAWSPDGRHIASASDDKTVQVWQAL